MFCLLNKFVLFNNQKQPLKFVRQNSYLDLSSCTLYIIWQGVQLLKNLQAGGTNKWTTNMKSLTGISQGFDNCRKATLQNNYFWEMSPMTASALKHDRDISSLFISYLRTRSLVVSDLRSVIKGFRFEPGCLLWAEVSSLH